MITLKSPQEIKIMRSAGKIVGDLLKTLGGIIRPGITTLELDKFAEDFILSRNGKPAFKGYVSTFKKSYPTTLCTSVNESIVHEIPSRRVLKDGDIISIDVGVLYKGYYGDAAYTFPVGEIDAHAQKLIKVTQEALRRGINQARDGNRLFDIGNAIQSYAEKNGFSVVREFTGHGIGTQLHEEPAVLNFGPPHRGPKLKSGMTIAIEPMITTGTGRAKILSDHWTAVTLDGKLCAHFEHTIAITNSTPEILTLPSEEK